MIQVFNKKEQSLSVLRYSLTEIQELKDYVNPANREIVYDHVTGLPSVKIVTKSGKIVQCKSGDYIVHETVMVCGKEYDNYEVYTEEEFAKHFVIPTHKTEEKKNDEDEYSSYGKYILADIHSVYAKLISDDKYEIIDRATGVKMVAKKEDFEKRAIPDVYTHPMIFTSVQYEDDKLSKESIQYGDKN